MKTEDRIKKNGWKAVALGDLVEPAQTWNPSHSPSDERFNYIDLSAVDQRAKLVTGAREVSCGNAPSRARQLVARGDVLVSTVRPNLNGVARVPDELDGATASTGFCVLRARDSKFDGGYLFHWVKSPAFVADMVNKATGASYPAVSDRLIFNSRIPLPPLEDQRRIAGVLDRVEVLLAKRRAALAQLDSLAQAIMTELLMAARHEFKTKPLDMIASDMHQGINTVTEKIEYQSEGYPIIQSKHVTQGYLDLSDVRFVNAATFAKYKDKYRPAKNDLLLCNIGTIGNTLLVERNIDFLIAWNLFLIKIDEHQVSPYYCKHYFDYLAAQHYFDQFLTGGTVKFISKKTLGATPIPIPPPSLQREFERRVISVGRLKTAQCASLSELNALLVTLQDRAFRGEL